MAKEGKSKKRKEREEAAAAAAATAAAAAAAAAASSSEDDSDDSSSDGGASQGNVEAEAEAEPEAGTDKRFQAQGFVRLQPKAVLDIGTAGDSNTELWLLQLPYECDLAGDGELEVRHGEDGELQLTCTTEDGVECTSVEGPLADYGGRLYATPGLWAGSSSSGQPRAFDRVLTFADDTYACYLPPAAGPEEAAAAVAPAAAGGSPGKEHKKRRKEKHEGGGSGGSRAEGCVQEKKKKKKDKLKKEKRRHKEAAA